MLTRARIAEPNTDGALLGWTLPAILDYVCSHRPNPCALNQRVDGRWQAISTQAYRQQADEIAAALESFGYGNGDRAALWMRSDATFVIADMGTLVAGLVNVPIYPSSDPAAVAFILSETAAKVLFVNDIETLERLTDRLATLDELCHVVVTDGEPNSQLLGALQVLGLEELRRIGRARLDADAPLPERLRSSVNHRDLATIIYTSGTTGRPKGVMLSHENLSSNGLTSFSELPAGPTTDSFVSFLPLAHVFQRSSHYAFVFQGGPIYFCEPTELIETLRETRPTIVVTVPRVLERVYERIRFTGAELRGVKRLLYRWALKTAERFELGKSPGVLRAIEHRIVDVIVFRKWREALGGRIRYLICGGAPLEPSLANFFAAIGMIPLQGYGLTETSPVITFNRAHRNRAGVVGEPLPGVEVRLADDGEVCARGPNVTMGYYLRADATAAAIDDEGWFHTGDIGEFDDDGFLRITDRRDNLFKLSTGRYVTPQPLETRLTAEPLICETVVVGAGRKYAAALIFTTAELVEKWARLNGLPSETPVDDLAQHPRLLARFQQLVDRANRGMPEWSRIQRFTVLLAELSTENQLLTPTLKVRRRKLHDVFANRIESLYEPDPPHIESP